MSNSVRTWVQSLPDYALVGLWLDGDEWETTGVVPKDGPLGQYRDQMMDGGWPPVPEPIPVPVMWLDMLLREVWREAAARGDIYERVAGERGGEG